jgi:hypothetical protein
MLGAGIWRLNDRLLQRVQAAVVLAGHHCTGPAGCWPPEPQASEELTTLWVALGQEIKQRIRKDNQQEIC